MKLISYWLLLSTCGILLIIIPLLLLSFNNSSPIRPNFLSESSFINVMQKSNALYVLHLSIVLSILPSAIEVLIDIVEQKAAYLSSIHTNQRFIFCVAALVNGTVFLVFRSSEIIPLIYIGGYYCRNILHACLITMIAYSELAKDSFLINNSVAFCTVYTVSVVLAAYSSYYRRFFRDDSVAIATRITTLACVILYVLSLYRWLRLLTIRQNSCMLQFGRLSISEKRYLVTIIPFLINAIFRVVKYASYISGNDSDGGYWETQTESGLIMDICGQYLTVLVVSILTGRVIRDLMVASANTLRLKQTFVRQVSHEIRSPLNVVHAGLDLLMSEIKDADPEAATVPISRSTVELIYCIFSSSESAIEILNDLLQYEQIDAGMFNLEFSWRELGGSLHNKLNWAQIMADRDNITLSTVDVTLATRIYNPTGEIDVELGGEVESSLLLQRDAYFHMDVFRIDQVIRNIITNAMKFTPAGGRVQINIICEMQNQENRNKIVSKFGVDAVGFFRMEVVDTGVGLSSEDQKRIFGEFTQFNRDELRGGGGSGLGLWISKRIVQMHKGTMGASSAGLGLGTTVYFELPLFSAAMAGKQPLAPLITDYPSQAQQASSMNDSPMRSNEGDRYQDRGQEEVMSTPERKKPRPSSPPLTGSAIYVVETASDESNASPTHLLRQKPMRGEAWASEPERNHLHPAGESPPRREMPDETALHAQVSRVVEFVDGKVDDDKIIPPRQMSILVVDDLALNRKVIVKIIESEKTGKLKNARLLEADDGTTAVEILRRELSEGRKIDFVLMDYVMIRMHGPEAAIIMRNDIQYTGFIIAVTGNALPDDMARFIASGANKVLTKPLTKMKLLNALDRFMPP